MLYDAVAAIATENNIRERFGSKNIQQFALTAGQFSRLQNVSAASYALSNGPER